MTQAVAPRPVNPGEKQAEAANPLHSVWVGASAGTGKTKVLIDRVLRLMLPRPGMGLKSATRPDKILCLTFTKTAAAEMSNRIYERLSEWSVKSDAELHDDLARLIGQPPDREIEEEARRLFARVLDTPGGLRIMTIHSFCQSVLKRFPIEAGLPPHFQLMDDVAARELLTRSLHEIIEDSRAAPQGPLAAAFGQLALLMNAEEMGALMQSIMAKRTLLGEILRHHGDASGAARTVEAVHRLLGVDPGLREEDVLAQACRLHPEQERQLRAALQALLAGSKSDLDKAACLEPWLAQPAKRGELFDFYCGGFFTQKGEIVKALATKTAQKHMDGLVEVLQQEAERLLEVRKRLQGIRLARVNGALLTVAAEMMGRYARHKRDHDSLDYDDLIIRTCDLLSQREDVQWVLYKLDEGIDHILVDEAQDTSPYQWRVVQALTQEFFAGHGSRDDTTRTLFVVGDEKQSIFSFQGADPAEFNRMKAYFGRHAAEVQAGWEVFLDYSFRSTRTVLSLVDKVFNIETVREGVVFDTARAVVHLPFREGHAGLVELWPLVTGAAREDMPAWQLPTALETGDDAASLLADKIAGTVAGWIRDGEMLESQQRPIRAGDVMILVQSRGRLVELIMRALKSAGVAVAGIDRMTLTEEISVMDLLAVAAFALQPRDDLSLATLLKSPLVGLDDDDLFRLCHARTASLWREVQAQRPDIAAYLRPFVARAGQATPYEFFAALLSEPCVADARSGRRGFYGRLGTDIHDALDEFLNSCLSYEQSHTPSLQRFIDWFMRGETEIKREQEGAGIDQVRIMTVHASKGLQAPIVFLPDATKKGHAHNRARPRLIWPADGAGLPLWSPRSEFETPFYRGLQQEQARRQEEEYRRLLYVALTRAEDRLYIAGHYNSRKPAADCWYHLVEGAFPEEAETIELAPAEGDAPPVVLRRLSHPQTATPKAARDNKAAAAPPAFRPLPDYALAPPEAEPSPSRPLTPSRPDEDEPAARGPLAADDSQRFMRGNIMHQILETLPQLPRAQWPQALSRYLSRPAFALAPEVQESFAREIMAVLNHPEFAEIFGPRSRAEVPVIGLAKPVQVMSGQMDRILVTEEEILIVDYKTNRPPPRDEADVPPVYLKQMATYVDIMKKIYPGRPVKAALLWTDGPYLMPLSEKSLDSVA